MHKHKHVRKSSLPGLEIIKILDINIDMIIDMQVEMGNGIALRSFKKKVLFKITNFIATYLAIFAELHFIVHK